MVRTLHGLLLALPALLLLLLQPGCKPTTAASDQAVPEATPIDIPADWTSVAPGIDVRVIQLSTSNGKVPVAVVRADPSKCRIRVVDAHKKVKNQGGQVEVICPPRGAAINASYFAEDLTPIGLTIIDGQKCYPRHPTGAWGYFLVKDALPRLQSGDDPLPEGVMQAIQCKPRLVVDGKVMTFKPQSSARRSAVGIDTQKRLIFAAADGWISLEEWANCLHDQLSCPDALNLDGGPSTQLAVRGKVNAAIAGGWPVPVFITVEPRE